MRSESSAREKSGLDLLHRQSPQQPANQALKREYLRMQALRLSLSPSAESPPTTRPKNKATITLRTCPEAHLSPLSSAETRPSTPRRPLALAQPNTPPIPHDVWAKILYDADFGSKVCEQFEYRQRHRPAKYGDLVVQAFPTLTPPEARELFWAAQKALKWREVRRKWQEKLDTVMSLTPEDESRDDGC